jgi:hypothetical protein
VGEFIQTIGGGIAGLVTGALHGIGDILRGMVNAAQSALPGGLLWVVVFVALVLVGWNLARR